MVLERTSYCAKRLLNLAGPRYGVHVIGRGRSRTDVGLHPCVDLCLIDRSTFPKWFDLERSYERISLSRSRSTCFEPC